MVEDRRRRANGERSRAKILEAAMLVAGERGYEGASISAVSESCGLPASSIYWHFKDKNDLIAAALEHSFQALMALFVLPGEDAGEPRERLVQMARRFAEALEARPAFLRLGLMLSLGRHSTGPKARDSFLRARGAVMARLAELIAELAPDADPASVRLIAEYALAGVDGLFVAKEIGGGAVDLPRLFEMHARLVHEAATTWTPSLEGAS